MVLDMKNSDEHRTTCSPVQVGLKAVAHAGWKNDPSILEYISLFGRDNIKTDLNARKQLRIVENKKCPVVKSSSNKFVLAHCPMAH
jgi:hypothetical protein